MRARRSHRAWGPLLALALVAGCAKDENKIVDPGPTQTVADSPENALRLMARAFAERDTLIYRGLFSADYVFDVTASDTAGTGSSTDDLDWDDEMRFARNCFRVGTSQLLPARTIVCVLDTLVALPDARPGKNATWHRQVDCRVRLTVDALDTVFEIDDDLRFYTVRGDSASVTAEIRGTGSLPDNQRWYLERIEPISSPAAPLPSAAPTLGRLKLAYLVP